MPIGINPEKKLCFEYIVHQLIQWYKAINSIGSDEHFNDSNDLSKLKVLKLHFFVTAINSDRNSLLSVFNNFYAMPYGHVESEIYNLINSDGLENFSFTDSKIEIRGNFLNNVGVSFNGLSPLLRKETDDAVKTLRNSNPNLVAYKALDLVELSHNWFSWKVVFDLARTNDKFSEKIPSELIKTEPKIFFIPA